MKRLLYLIPFVPGKAHAFIASQTGTSLDALIPTWGNFIVGSLIPLTILIAILTFCWKVIKGYEYGEWAVRLVIIGVVLALGLAGFSRIFGGTIVTSLVG